MKTKLILLIINLISFSIYAEIIDGPANIRDSINGKVLFSLENGVEIECSKENNGWHVIGFRAVVPEDLENWILPKDFNLFSCDGKYLGKTLAPVEFSAMDENCAIISGYTYKSNIVESSKIESMLQTIIESNKTLHFNDFEKHIKKYNYHDDNQFDWGMTYIYYETWIIDLSPGARIRLIFEDNIFVGLIHTRQINAPNYNQYNILWDWKLSTNLNTNNPKIKSIINSYKHFLQSVD
ncbi:hypothetical protein [Mangrovimonas sp. YM274]|uniref:hypothetical protein n=1 Tax=Mangrovimonas sp. YM274 TaxID=3070660 RepID=UPI0027DE5979|nr:hypothetical protein [Mangrovimonas sp. YM274]WMI68251.1 hypothetical protein RBH95_14010 [Mangrovimonas sp. YM274]